MDPYDQALATSLNLLDKAGIDTSEFVSRWSEPQRVYHTLGNHLRHMIFDIFSISDFYELEQSDILDLVLAAWLHDIVYIPGSPTNESDSMTFWNSIAVPSFCNGIAVPSKLISGAEALEHMVWINKISRMIMVTKHHVDPVTFLEAILIDCDLAGLGTPRYGANRVHVRNEYGIDDDMNPLWIEGRKKFLTEYNSRPVLFYTSWGSQFEDPARFNMTLEMNSLTREDASSSLAAEGGSE